MRKTYIKGLKRLSKPNGTYVAVPTTIYRLNNIFYNTKVLKQTGVDPATTQDPASLTNALLATVEQNTNAVGMAQATKNPFTTIRLWEMIFLGEQRSQAYRDLLNGNIIQKHEQDIKSALKRVNEYRKHWNKDAGSIAWDQANAKVINGKAAFHHHGGWAAGQYKAQKNMKYQQDWDYIHAQTSPKPDLQFRWQIENSESVHGLCSSLIVVIYDMCD